MLDGLALVLASGVVVVVKHPTTADLVQWGVPTNHWRTSQSAEELAVVAVCRNSAHGCKQKWWIPATPSISPKCRTVDTAIGRSPPTAL